jgi:uncharacterized protein
MFLERSISTNNPFWKYILGSVVIIFSSQIGQLPLLFVLFTKSLMEEKPFPSTNDDVMNFLEPNVTLFLVLFSFVTTLIGIFFVIRFFHRQTILEVTTGRKKVDLSRILFSFSIWSIFTIISTLIIYFINPENFTMNFKPIPFLILSIIGVLMIPIQTSTEEYVFRGYLLQGFANLSKNKWFPLMMTSVIFGTMHILNPEVQKMGYIILVFYIGTGLFLGIITLMDDGMELALGFHAANNLISALLVTSDWSVFKTHSILKDISEPTAGVDVLVPVFVIFPILLFIFSKKYNWSNWKENLTGNIITENNQ